VLLEPLVAQNGFGHASMLEILIGKESKKTK